MRPTNSEPKLMDQPLKGNNKTLHKTTAAHRTRKSNQFFLFAINCREWSIAKTV